MPLNMYQEKTQNTSPMAQIKNTIAIAAGKGGVGKSTVTVNLALALQQLGHSVGILDADIYGPSIRMMLPEDRLPSQKGQDFIPAICRGIRMISMAYFRKEHEAAAVRAPIANGIISQFIQNVMWGPLDYLLVDFPPGTGDVQLTLSQKLNLSGAIMVTTPQEVALLDVRKAMHLFDQVQIPIIGIVENMSYYQHSPKDEKLYLFGKGGGERLARDYGLPLLGAIPIDPKLSSSGDKGESIFSLENSGEHISAQVFLSLAKQLVDHVSLIKGASAHSLSNFELIWKEMPT
jgi:ATP-binding protein involved in chromosome partitioning